MDGHVYGILWHLPVGVAMNDTPWTFDDYDYGYDDYDVDPRPKDKPRLKVGDTCIINPKSRYTWTEILHHPDRLFTIRRIVTQDEGGWDIVELNEPNSTDYAVQMNMPWVTCNESYLVLAGHTTESESSESYTQTKVAAVESFTGRKFR